MTCRLISLLKGSFSEDDDDVVIFMEESSPSTATSDSSRKLLWPTTRCDSDEADTSSATTEDSTLWDSFSENDRDPYVSLEYVLSKLTDSEREAAARVNYQYDCMARARGSGSIESYNGRDFSSDIRDRAAMMTFRHFYAECNGNADKALRRMKSSIESREECYLNSVRHCFQEDTPAARDLCRKIRKYTGPAGRIFVRGYDQEGRAFIHIIARNSSPHLKVDTEGDVEAHAYNFEKATACTERRTGGRRGDVNVCLDFAGFRPWHLSASLLRDLLFLIMKHHMGRLHMAYAVDAPLVFRVVWQAVSVVLSAEMESKFCFQSKRELEAIFRKTMEASQAMPYQRSDGLLTRPVDVDAYFQLPFTLAYDEI